MATYGPSPAVAISQPLYASRLDGDESIDFIPASGTDYGAGVGNGVPFGAVLVVGTIVAIALVDIAAGKTGSLNVRGRFLFPKSGSEANLVQGADAFWDSTNHIITGNPNNSTACYWCGKVAVTAATSDTTIAVTLNATAAETTVPGWGTRTVNTVAAAGTNQANAAALVPGLNIVTGADGTKGVTLPTAPAPGTMVIVKGTTSGTLNIYPDPAATINAVSSHGAYTTGTVAPTILIASSATQWYSLPLVAS